ncbi:hypothetical protein [Winogradskyella wichelsiae]|uniref:hypothetical protein n=1 Tax=Winogradskyella wichelsiae TaxID=2697007 RepID=UPI0015C8BC42|nr:hypothetical protein [Winogradskyella wichelsiae]
MNKIFSIIKDENILLKIRKKSETSFSEYHFLGFLSFFYNLGHDYLIITNKRIVVIIKDELIKNVEYQVFSSLEFNSNNNNLQFKNHKGQTQIINLNRFRPSYEDIQNIKKILNKTSV